MQVAIFLIFCLAIYSILKISLRIFGDIWSPLGIHGFVWFGGLGLYSLKIVNYDSLTIHSWLILIGSFFAFGLGCFISLFPYARQKTLMEKAKFDEFRTRWCVYVLFSIGMVGFVVNTLSFVNSYGLSGMLTAWRSVRQEFGVEFFELPFAMNVLNVPLAYFYLRNFKKRRSIIFVMMIISLFVLPSAFNKTNFIRAMVILFFVYAVTSQKKIPLKAFIAVGLVSLLFFMGYWYFSYRRNPYTYYVEDQKFRLPKSISIIAQPYVYMTANFPAFQAMANDISSLEYYRATYPWGYKTFFPFYVLLSKIDNSLSAKKIPGKFYNVPIPYNTYTYLRHFYSDFGAIGAIIFPFLIGLGSSFLFLQITKAGKIEYFLLYGVVGWCLFISFFSNHFSYLNVWYFCILSFLIGKIIKTRDSK